jgi:hypothetical protein
MENSMELETVNQEETNDDYIVQSYDEIIVEYLENLYKSPLDILVDKLFD